MKSPDTTVTSFIHAHAQWNKRSNDRCKAFRPGSVEYQRVMEIVKSEYKDIMKQLGCSTVNPQPISFGDNPMHDQQRESIESVIVEEGTATVRTRLVGIYDLVSIYEYRLVKEFDEWRISSLMYIDDDGSYECL